MDSFQQHCQKVAKMDWQELEHIVSGCVLCPLHKSRTQTVFGVGNHQAKILFIGEGPGHHEDLQGVPFVGQAGKLLDIMLTNIGLDRNKVYITNLVKCRPPNNRVPLPSEIDTCTPYLERQISLLNLKLIVALGKTAAHYLLNTKAPLTELRGTIHKYIFGTQEINAIVTFHPAYLLRVPQDKAKSQEDFALIHDIVKHR